MNERYRYTYIMQEKFGAETSKLMSFYCREDFEQALLAYRSAKKSNIEFRKKDLADMCVARGIDADRLIADRSLLDTIPTRQELTAQLMESYYSLYSFCPSPAAYMERMVRRLAPEYDNHTVRTAILKKFVLGCGVKSKTYKTKGILAWAVEKMDADTQNAYENASPDDKLIMAVNALDDSIFLPEHLTVEITNRDMLELMDRRRSRLTAKIQELQTAGVFADQSNSARNKLRDFCRKQDIEHSPSDSPAILSEKIMERTREFCKEQGFDLDPAADFVDAVNTMLDSLLAADVSLITSEQMTYLDACYWLLMRKIPHIKKTGAVGTADELFRNDISDLKAAKTNPEWNLLRISNILAEGTFKNNSNTRFVLYQFAIMFGMTIKLKDSDEFSKDRDVVKNLFENYYCDNMVRFLNSTFDKDGLSTTLEREPGGEGINWKNYAEAIYVYFIYRTDLKLTPGQRIDHAESAIKQCGELAKAKPQTALPFGKNAHTYYYEQQMINKIVNVKEEQLADMIYANYHIDPEISTKADQASDTNTAFELLKEAALKLQYPSKYDNLFMISYGSNEESEELAKQLLDDVRYKSDIRFQWKLSQLLTAHYADDKNFCRMVEQIESRLTKELHFVGAAQIDILADLLHTLCLETNRHQTLSMEKLKEKLSKDYFAVNGDDIHTYVKYLTAMGFSIQRKLINKESHFCMETLQYEDELLSEMIVYVTLRHSYNDKHRVKARRKLFNKLLDERVYTHRRITRTTLLAALCSAYITDVQDAQDLVAFPNIYDDFKETVNDNLVYCRFQPLSEKNALDMFVILSIYLYLIENGKGDV